MPTPSEEQAVMDPITDPTVKKDPKKEQDNITPDHPRWKELYHESKEAKRELEKVRGEYDGLKKSTDVMMQHYRTLEETIKERPVPQPTATSQMQPPSIGDVLRSKKAELRSLRESDEPDRNKMYALEDEIESLNVENITKKFSSMIPDTKKAYQEYSQASQEEVLRAAAQNFTSSAPWFSPNNPEFNQMMHATAVGLDLPLSQEFPDPTRRYQEIKKRVEEQFAYKGAGIPTPNNLTVEDGGNPPAKKNGEIKLTDDELEAISRLYPDEDPVDVQKRIIKHKEFILSRGRV